MIFQKILFTFYKGGKISVASIDVNGSNLVPIIRSTVDSNYYNPQFSPDGSRILFIGSKRNNLLGCSMFLSDKSGKNKVEILRDSGEIIEAVFSACGNKIYFVKSKEYGHYSPLGKSGAHNSDVYSISLLDYKVEQITNYEAYSMYRISEYNCDSITLNMTTGKGNGLAMFSKKNPSHITYFNPINNPRADSSFYDTPFYSKRYKIMGFIAPYELYIMSMDDRKASLVLYDNDNVKYYKFFNNKKKIVYTSNNKPVFNIINFKGSIVKKIDVESMLGAF
jgi:hypothetical protein